MRTIFHLTSHKYKGVLISPYGIGYVAIMGNVILGANSWVRLETMIDTELNKK